MYLSQQNAAMAMVAHNSMKFLKPVEAMMWLSGPEPAPPTVIVLEPMARDDDDGKIVIRVSMTSVLPAGGGVETRTLVTLGEQPKLIDFVSLGPHYEGSVLLLVEFLTVVCCGIPKEVDQ